jgi:hypothetical protein
LAKRTSRTLFSRTFQRLYLGLELAYAKLSGRNRA